MISKWHHIENKIDSIAEAFFLNGKVKGFSVAIMQQNDTIYNRGFGFMDSIGIDPPNITPINIFNTNVI